VPLYKTDAVIIRNRELGEADRIFILCSPLYGKIDSIARGVRRPGSRFGGSLEVFSHVYLLLSQGKSLDIITQVEVCNPHYSLREDLERLSCASYFLEMVEMSLVPGQEAIDLFALVLSGLSLLEHHTDLELVLRYLEIQYLNNMGVGPVLDRCQSCNRVFSSPSAIFHFSSGGAFCRECRPLNLSGYFCTSVETLNFLEYLSGIEPQQLGNISVTPKIYGESKYLLQNLLLYHLNKDIKSLKILDSIMKK